MPPPPPTSSRIYEDDSVFLNTVTFDDNVVVSGNLTVNGTTTTINSSTLEVDDKNIVLGETSDPTDITANGGGITLKGSTDKTFNWDSTNGGAWTSSENINLALGKEILIDGVAVYALKADPTFTGTVDTTGAVLNAGTLTSAKVAISNNNNSVATTSAVKDVTDTLAPKSNPTISNPTFTGTVDAIGATLNAAKVAINDNNNSVATTSAVKDVTDTLAPKANPTFTGTVTLPQPSTESNSTEAATTAFVRTIVGTTQPDVSKASIGLSNVTNESKTTMFTDPDFESSLLSRIQLGGDINGIEDGEENGYGVSISGDGTTIAVGSNGLGIRVYKYEPTKTTAQMDSSQPGFGPAYWSRMGSDFNGGLGSGKAVSLTHDGLKIAIGYPLGNPQNPNLPFAGYAGIVSVFQYNTNTLSWQKMGGDITYSEWPSGTGQDLNFTNYQYNTRSLTWSGLSNSGCGSSVSIISSSNETIVAIGGKGTASNGPWTPGGSGGIVTVYKYDQNKTSIVYDIMDSNYGPVGWKMLGNEIRNLNIYNTNDASLNGSSVSLLYSSNGIMVATGQPGYSRAIVYKYNPNKTTPQPNPSQQGYGPVGWDRVGQEITGSNNYGSSVSIISSSNETILAIGAPGNDNAGPGYVGVYKYNPTTLVWEQLGGIISGGNDRINSGTSVCLSSSSSGIIVASGAPFTSTKTGNLIGSVSLYKYDSTKTTAQMDSNKLKYGPVGWNQICEDLFGEGFYKAKFGSSVGLSADGTRIIVGSPGWSYNVTTENSKGQSIVYDISTNTSVSSLNVSKLSGVKYNIQDQLDGKATNITVGPLPFKDLYNGQIAIWKRMNYSQGIIKYSLKIYDDGVWNDLSI